MNAQSIVAVLAAFWFGLYAIRRRTWVSYLVAGWFYFCAAVLTDPVIVYMCIIGIGGGFTILDNAYRDDTLRRDVTRALCDVAQFAEDVERTMQNYRNGIMVLVLASRSVGTDDATLRNMVSTLTRAHGYPLKLADVRSRRHDPGACNLPVDDNRDCDRVDPPR